MSSDPAPPPKQDVVFVHSRSDEGESLRVIRKRDETIELGEIREAREGRPVHGELVQLRQRKEHERLFDVEVLATREELKQPPALGHAGPAQVATDAYRENWEAIFGGTQEPRLPN
jgi:hypothetical protein